MMMQDRGSIVVPFDVSKYFDRDSPSYTIEQIDDSQWIIRCDSSSSPGLLNYLARKRPKGITKPLRFTCTRVIEPSNGKARILRIGELVKDIHHVDDSSGILLEFGGKVFANRDCFCIAGLYESWYVLTTKPVSVTHVVQTEDFVKMYRGMMRYGFIICGLFYRDGNVWSHNVSIRKS